MIAYDNTSNMFKHMLTLSFYTMNGVAVLDEEPAAWAQGKASWQREFNCPAGVTALATRGRRWGDLKCTGGSRWFAPKNLVEDVVCTSALAASVMISVGIVMGIQLFGSPSRSRCICKWYAIYYVCSTVCMVLQFFAKPHCGHGYAGQL